MQPLQVWANSFCAGKNNRALTDARDCCPREAAHRQGGAGFMRPLSRSDVSPFPPDPSTCRTSLPRRSGIDSESAYRVLSSRPIAAWASAAWAALSRPGLARRFARTELSCEYTPAEFLRLEQSLDFSLRAAIRDVLSRA